MIEDKYTLPIECSECGSNEFRHMEMYAVPQSVDGNEYVWKIGGPSRGYVCKKCGNATCETMFTYPLLITKTKKLWVLCVRPFGHNDPPHEFVGKEGRMYLTW